MVDKRTELTGALEEYRKLSEEIQSVYEDIIATSDPEAEWVIDVKKDFQSFLESDAEIFKAFDEEIEKAEDSSGSSEGTQESK